ncbi:SRPBCC family protein [Halosolutus gelatinilyticus]|uniref:SRPBCC family protein n=1 Tax=Halosolutus gelatinilyticus TaxID=2931975 RepID=UPI001FF1CCA2|nr:SRPBCC family protein [Halosolutus gelatinilyticus]
MTLRSLARILQRVRPGRSNAPSTSATEYHFVTRWRVQGTVEEVADVLSDPTDLPRWWPSVYLDAQLTKPGDEDGIGKEVSLYTTGWLPYTLRWDFRVTESDYPHGFALEAQGDFVGRGEWTLRQDGDQVAVTYEWRVRAEKPLLRRFSFLLRPVFEANHQWAMARGEESLRLELARRAATGDERHQIPPPPGPTSLRTVLSPKTLFGLISTAVGSVAGRRRDDSTSSD